MPTPPASFQTTRRRLALWYSTVTAILLVFFAASVYLYVRVTLVDRVDDTLKHVIEVVERSLVVQREASPTASGVAATLAIDLDSSFRRSDPTRNFDEDRIDLEWFSPTGELLWTTWDRLLDIPLDFSPSGRTVFEPPMLDFAHRPDPLDFSTEIVTDRAEPLRQITKLIKRDRQPLGYLRVSHPWFEVTKPSQDLIVDLGFGIFSIVAAVGAIGWWLSGIAMRPVLDSYERLRQFTADASHELRSPIASLQTNLQVALQVGPVNSGNSGEPEQVGIRDRLDVALRTTRRLSQLVDDLLFLARQDNRTVEVQLEPLPLDALLLETVEEQQAIATAKNLSLHLEIDDAPDTENAIEPYQIDGDWSQIVRLFANLIANAIQYTPPGGEISVKLRDAFSGDDRRTIVEIRDTGIGIAKDQLARIFERFYRVDGSRQRQAGGAGLGLAIVRAIVERHSAKIAIDSQRDRGTTVAITFSAHTP
ncbi:MAG: sensor histidine kinase [Geitlerinemataceae cyanobacterium]